MPDEKLLADMGKFNEELAKAGIMIAGEGLKPSSEGVRVHFSGADRSVTDGPFAETKELVAGYWVWEVASMAEAIDWVNQNQREMTMKTNPVCWFEIYVQEMDRAKKFYETVLGTELTKLESPMPEIEMLAFPMEMDGAAQRVLWSKWMVPRREGAAPCLVCTRKRSRL